MLNRETSVFGRGVLKLEMGFGGVCENNNGNKWTTWECHL